MSGRFILMAAGLLAGILIGIGGWLPACLLLLWLLVKTTRNLVIVVSLAILVGLGRGLIDAQQWRQPPVPQGSIVIPATALKLKEGYASFTVSLRVSETAIEFRVKVATKYSRAS